MHVFIGLGIILIITGAAGGGAGFIIGGLACIVLPILVEYKLNKD